MASDDRQKREGMYVYNMAAEVPRASAKSAISKGWGSFVRSKTYRERSEREKVVVDEAAEQRRKSERRSVSAAEGNVGAVAALLHVKVLVSDMPGFMQLHAFRCARTTYDALDKFSSKYMAYNIKKINALEETSSAPNLYKILKFRCLNWWACLRHQESNSHLSGLENDLYPNNEFDKVYGPAWHCIVGSSFGSFVTHSTGGFLYFSMEKLYILVFKTKVERALLDQV